MWTVPGTKAVKFCVGCSQGCRWIFPAYRMWHEAAEGNSIHDHCWNASATSARCSQGDLMVCDQPQRFTITTHYCYAVSCDPCLTIIMGFFEPRKEYVETPLWFLVNFCAIQCPEESNVLNMGSCKRHISCWCFPINHIVCAANRVQAIQLSSTWSNFCS